jgi:superfamily II DNA or RNA helicase
MSLVDIKERYDSFQKVAVQAIVRDFSRKSNGRYLLVIPTGGGKTHTAVKSICQLFNQNILNPAEHKILWTAHRRELLTQAEDTFKEIIREGETSCSLEENITLKMISQAPKVIQNNTNIKLVVIDEAHHGAANSYIPIFEKRDIGILGLTATPSRHDGQPLDFERESFSIGFPDLIKKGIILKPEVREIKGGIYKIPKFDEEDLEKLNNDERNQKIIRELSSHKDQYRKVIIYVGTKKHAEDLYKLLIATPLKAEYESISFIVGDRNSRNQSREEYVKTEQEYKRSILVNVQVLSEGYDDPTVNTVIMAAPSRSKLYYMQAMGRAVRIDPNDFLKKAYVVEVVDNLPNIRYRIDNRWLYSDISDALEPEVKDITYSSEQEFIDSLEKIYTNYNVPKSYHVYPEYNEDYRYSILLFRQYQGPGSDIHYPLLIDNENRTKVSNMYNFISERMVNFRNRQINFEAVFRMLGEDGTGIINDMNERKLIYDAMENACATCQEGEDGLLEYIKTGYPWITFIALNFRKREVDILEDLMDFIGEMVNKDDIYELLITKNYEKNSILIRLPLPLKSFVGKFITNLEFKEVEKIIEKLVETKELNGDKDHRMDVDLILRDAILPIEIKHSDSLVLIARDSVNYYMPLR